MTKKNQLPDSELRTQRKLLETAAAFHILQKQFDELHLVGVKLKKDGDLLQAIKGRTILRVYFSGVFTGAILLYFALELL